MFIFLLFLTSVYSSYCEAYNAGSSLFCANLGEADCQNAIEYTIFAGPSPGYVKCIWDGTSCTRGPACTSNCFAGGKTQVSSCSSASGSCLNSFQGSLGSTYACKYNSLSNCIPDVPCSASCLGYDRAGTCSTSWTQWQCPLVYQKIGSSFYNCVWNGTACGLGQSCTHRCYGANITTNCGAYTNATSCSSKIYQNATGMFDCVWNTVTNICQQGTDLCAFDGVAQCTGSLTTVQCGSILTQSTCPTYRQVRPDYGTQNCVWDLHQGKCRTGMPCF